jgi:oxygen-independent coproporphyrinogen-3 oxidase
MLGLYIHIPFCSAICSYCNFNRGLFDGPLKRRYVDALCREIAAAGDGAPADTLFFGGGTPSLLEPDEIETIVATCRDAFAVTVDAEVTLEANPETVTVDRLAAFRHAGVNRLSLGVQSFHDVELQRLGRIHSSRRAADALQSAREAGFDNVSLDLMMWLPEQTLSQWLTSVDRLIALGPDHASLYLLELYPNAPLREAMARGRWSQAPEDDAADMYEHAMDRLESAGYRQYEISNVERPGRRSRHNLKYWTDGEWLGFGCGAHSTRAGVRWKNLASTEEYVTRVGAGETPVVERRVLSSDEHLEEALFMGLRLNEGLDLAQIRDRHGVDVWARYGADLAPHVEAELVVLDRDDRLVPRRLRLTRRGMLLSHEVMTVFL